MLNSKQFIPANSTTFEELISTEIAMADEMDEIHLELWESSYFSGKSGIPIITYDVRIRHIYEYPSFGKGSNVQCGGSRNLFANIAGPTREKGYEEAQRRLYAARQFIRSLCSASDVKFIGRIARQLIRT